MFELCGDGRRFGLRSGALGEALPQRLAQGLEASGLSGVRRAPIPAFPRAAGEGEVPARRRPDPTVSRFADSITTGRSFNAMRAGPRVVVVVVVVTVVRLSLRL